MARWISTQSEEWKEISKKIISTGFQGQGSEILHNADYGATNGKLIDELGRSWQMMRVIYGSTGGRRQGREFVIPLRQLSKYGGTAQQVNEIDVSRINIAGIQRMQFQSYADRILSGGRLGEQLPKLEKALIMSGYNTESIEQFLQPMYTNLAQRELAEIKLNKRVVKFNSQTDERSLGGGDSSGLDDTFNNSFAEETEDTFQNTKQEQERQAFFKIIQQVSRL